MSGKRAAREGDRVKHGGCCSELEHIQENVSVEGELLATVDTSCTHPGEVSAGSKKVFCHGKAVAREGDSVSCGGTIYDHAKKVFIG